MTRRRPKLSDSKPKQKEPSMLAILNKLITQPVSWSVRAFAVRSNVGAHAAALQNTDPPRNSARARIRMERENAFLTEPVRVSDRVERKLRTQKSCNSMSAAAIAPTVRNAIRQPNAAVTRLANTAPTPPPVPQAPDTRLVPGPRLLGSSSDMTAYKEGAVNP